MIPKEKQSFSKNKDSLTVGALSRRGVSFVPVATRVFQPRVVFLIGTDPCQLVQLLGRLLPSLLTCPV